MTLDYVSQALLVLIPSIIALVISYGFFKNDFSYFLFFEVIFLALFVGLNVIDYFYISFVILFISILIYQALAPVFKEKQES